MNTQKLTVKRLANHGGAYTVNAGGTEYTMTFDKANGYGYEWLAECGDQTHNNAMGHTKAEVLAELRRTHKLN